MSLLRAEIDPNCRAEGNNTLTAIACLSNKDAEFFNTVDLIEYVKDHKPLPETGIPVIVVEPESEIEGFGWIYKILWDKGLVYIKVDWSSLR